MLVAYAVSATAGELERVSVLYQSGNIYKGTHLDDYECISSHRAFKPHNHPHRAPPLDMRFTTIALATLVGVVSLVQASPNPVPDPSPSREHRHMSSSRWSLLTSFFYSHAGAVYMQRVPVQLRLLLLHVRVLSCLAYTWMARQLSVQTMPFSRGAQTYNFAELFPAICPNPGSCSSSILVTALFVDFVSASETCCKINKSIYLSVIHHAGSFAVCSRPEGEWHD